VALAIACLKAVLLVTMMLSDYYWRNWGHLVNSPTNQHWVPHISPSFGEMWEKWTSIRRAKVCKQNHAK
jgi:hypothetical protein